MLALIVSELSNLLRVAGAALICNFACKRHVQRHMRVHVTVEAVLKFEMELSLMALCALRDLTMDRVTGVTVNGTMPAFMLPEFSVLLRVAVKANIIACQGHIQRHMRVLVTLEAVVKFKVGLPRTKVTSAAFLDRFFYCRRVADMAASAGNCSVPPSGSFYVIHRPAMTFHTVFFFRRSICLSR
jgi:hypothetical protein